MLRAGVRTAVQWTLPLVLLSALAALAGCDGSEGISPPYTLNKIKIAPTQLEDATVGHSYSRFIEASGGVGEYQWEVFNGSLPVGMSISPIGKPNTALFGSPATAGLFNFSLRVTDGRGETTHIDLALRVHPSLLRITTSYLPPADCNQGYAQFIRAVDGSGQGYLWQITEGSLPPGMAIDPTGTPQTAIAGQGTTPGIFAFTVQVMDSMGHTDTMPLRITVLPPLSILTTEITPLGCQGVPYPGATLQATGGTGTYTWTLVSPPNTLPPGIYVLPSGGIVGDPTLEGTFQFSVRVRDTHNIQSTSVVWMTILPPVLLAPTTLPEATVGEFFSQQFSAAGGDGGQLEFSIVGAAPPGLSIQPDGLFRGTPGAAGSYLVTFQAMSSPGSYGRLIVSFVIAEPLAITTTTLPEASRSTGYIAPIHQSGGTPPYLWSVSAGLTPGLAIVPTGNPNSAIYGVATQMGSFVFTVTVTDSQGRSDDQQLTLLVDFAPGEIETYAGGGNTGDGHPALDAVCAAPGGIAVDGAGNTYYSETGAHRVRKVNSLGVVSTIAGGNFTAGGYGGDNGPAAAAQLNAPRGLALNVTQSLLYIADSANSRVRAVNLNSGLIVTVAGTGVFGGLGDGGPAAGAQLKTPYDLAVDMQDRLYIADSADHRVRRVDAQGLISTSAGDGVFGHSGDGGPATAASLAAPEGICLDELGNLYIACAGCFTVRRVSAAGQITTLAGQAFEQQYAGDGSFVSNARFVHPRDVAVDEIGNIYVSDYDLNYSPAPGQTTPGPFVVRRVSPTPSVIQRFAGTLWTAGFSGDGGPAVSATLRAPAALATDAAGNLFICDEIDHRIRRVDALTLAISTFVGTGGATMRGDGGPAQSALLRDPGAMAFDAQGNLYFCDRANHRVRRVDAQSKAVTTVAGNGSQGSSGDGGPAVNASLNLPTGLAFGPLGHLFVSEYGTGTAGSGHRIRRINLQAGTISHYAGASVSLTQSGDGGPALAANIAYPAGICFDSFGSLYIACPQHHVIRKVNTQGIASTFAGQAYTSPGPWFDGNGGLATLAHLHKPWSVAADVYNNIYICDTGNSCVRKVPVTGGFIVHYAGLSAGGVGAPIFGSGPDGGQASETALAYPTAICFDTQGNAIITDAGACVVRRVTPLGVITTVGGNAFEPQVTPGGHGDGGLALDAHFTAAAAASSFTGLRCVAAFGADVFVCDANQNPLSDRIRRLVKP